MSKEDEKAAALATLRLQRAEWATALLITLFAVALHALRLAHAGPLWRDEAAAFHLATSPTLGEVIAKHESFPPLFFLLVRVWAAGIGGSDAALRLFGLVVGLGLLAMLWWATRRIAGTVPLVALALVAVNPSMLIFGDSLRGYGIGTVAILAAYGAFARLASRPDRRGVVAAAGSALLSVQLLFFNAALLLALGLAALGTGILRGDRQRLRVVLAVGAIGTASALSLLPWTGPLLATRSWSMLLESSSGPREILGEMVRTASAPVATLQWVWLVLLALGVLAGTLPAGPGEDQERDVRRFALLSLPLVILAQWGFLAALGYAPRPWYFLPILALAAVSLDVLLATSSLLRTVRLGIAVLAVLALAVPGLSLARVRMTNVDLIAERIAAEAAPGDLVVVTPWHNGISYQRYSHGAIPWITLPDLADHRIHRYDLVKERMMATEPLAPVLGAVERTLRAGHQVWVAGEPEIPSLGTPVPVLPPAPAARSGWQEQPYLRTWSLQLGAFLRDHAAAGGRVPIPREGPVNGFEQWELLVFSGWR